VRRKTILKAYFLVQQLSLEEIVNACEVDLSQLVCIALLGSIGVLCGVHLHKSLLARQELGLILEGDLLVCRLFELCFINLPIGVAPNILVCVGTAADFEVFDHFVLPLQLTFEGLSLTFEGFFLTLISPNFILRL
jgi:hypothetical protein